MNEKSIFLVSHSKEITDGIKITGRAVAVVILTVDLIGSKYKKSCGEY